MANVLRVSRVEIDTAKINGENWVRADVQEVELDPDGNVLAERIADKHVYRRIADVALQPHMFINPLTKEPDQLTTIEIAHAIKAAMINWMLEDFDAVLDTERGLVVLKNGND